MKTEIVSSKDIAKYGRLDAKFFVDIKPKVDEFLRTHSVDKNGVIYKLKRTKLPVPKLSERNYCLLYSLIKYFEAYRLYRKREGELEKELGGILQGDRL